MTISLDKYISEVKDRAGKAKFSDEPYIIERIGFDSGAFSYEINTNNQLVSFYEDNFEQPMKAKFAAELYANASNDIDKLVRIVEIQKEALSIISRADYINFYKDEKFTHTEYGEDIAKRVLGECNKIAEGK